MSIFDDSTLDGKASEAVTGTVAGKGRLQETFQDELKETKGKVAARKPDGERFEHASAADGPDKAKLDQIEKHMREALSTYERLTEIKDQKEKISVQYTENGQTKTSPKYQAEHLRQSMKDHIESEMKKAWLLAKNTDPLAATIIATKYSAFLLERNKDKEAREILDAAKPGANCPKQVKEEYSSVLDTLDKRRKAGLHHLMRDDENPGYALERAKDTGKYQDAFDLADKVEKLAAEKRKKIAEDREAARAEAKKNGETFDEETWSYVDQAWQMAGRAGSLVRWDYARHMSKEGTCDGRCTDALRHVLKNFPELVAGNPEFARLYEMALRNGKKIIDDPFEAHGNKYNGFKIELQNGQQVKSIDEAEVTVNDRVLAFQQAYEGGDLKRAWKMLQEAVNTATDSNNFGPNSLQMWRNRRQEWSEVIDKHKSKKPKGEDAATKREWEDAYLQFERERMRADKAANLGGIPLVIQGLFALSPECGVNIDRAKEKYDAIKQSFPELISGDASAEQRKAEVADVLKGAKAEFEEWKNKLKLTDDEKADAKEKWKEKLNEEQKKDYLYHKQRIATAAEIVDYYERRIKLANEEIPKLKKAAEATFWDRAGETFKFFLKEITCTAAGIAAGAAAGIATSWTGPWSLVFAAGAGAAANTGVRYLWGDEITWWTPIEGAFDGVTAGAGMYARGLLFQRKLGWAAAEQVGKELVKKNPNLFLKYGGYQALFGKEAVVKPLVKKEVIQLTQKELSTQMAKEWAQVGWRNYFFRYGKDAASKEAAEHLVKYNSLKSLKAPFKSAMFYSDMAALTVMAPTRNLGHVTKEAYQGKITSSQQFITEWGTRTSFDMLSTTPIIGYSTSLKTGLKCSLATAVGRQALFGKSDSLGDFALGTSSYLGKDLMFYSQPHVLVGIPLKGAIKQPVASDAIRGSYVFSAGEVRKKEKDHLSELIEMFTNKKKKQGQHIFED